jgi:ribosome maturation factor RimP
MATAQVLAVAVRLEAERTTAQVAGEEVVMNGDSRHGSPRSAPRGGSADAERIVGLLEPTVAAMGMDLENVGITSAGRRRLLRVVVDADGGVSLDDIALVSRELSATLDRAAVMGESSYTLEVSSPGVDRPLTEPKHWRRAVGRLVTVPLRPGIHNAAAAAGSHVVTGRITGTDAHGVRLDVAGQSRRFGYSELGPGRIQVEFAPLDADEGGAGEGGPGLVGRAGAGGDGPGRGGGRMNSADLGAAEEGPDGH